MSRAAPQTTHQPHTLKTRLVEPVHGSRTGGFRLVIDKRAVALGDQKDAQDVFGRIPREMVLQVNYACAGGQVTNPERVSRLLRFPWRTTGDVDEVRIGRVPYHSVPAVAIWTAPRPVIADQWNSKG